MTKMSDALQVVQQHLERAYDESLKHNDHMMRISCYLKGFMLAAIVVIDRAREEALEDENNDLPTP